MRWTEILSDKSDDAEYLFDVNMRRLNHLSVFHKEVELYMGFLRRILINASAFCLRPEADSLVASLLRNQLQVCSGMGGRFGQESAKNVEIIYCPAAVATVSFVLLYSRISAKQLSGPRRDSMFAGEKGQKRNRRSSIFLFFHRVSEYIPCSLSLFHIFRLCNLFVVRGLPLCREPHVYPRN